MSMRVHFVFIEGSRSFGVKRHWAALRADQRGGDYIAGFIVPLATADDRDSLDQIAKNSGWIVIGAPSI